MKKVKNRLIQSAATLVLSIMMLLNTVLPCLAEIVPKGDLNGDGIVNSEDLILIKKSLLHESLEDYDLNGDGVFNLKDLVRLKKIAVNFVNGEKFEVIGETQLNNVTTYKLDDLFRLSNDSTVLSSEVNVEINTYGEVEYEFNEDSEYWGNSTVKFSGIGTVEIYICEYCIPTKADFEVLNADKFNTKHNDAIEVPVTTAITLGDIFEDNGFAVDSSNVMVEIEGIDETDIIFNQDKENWADSTLTFKALGTVTVKISENSNVAEYTFDVVMADKFSTADINEVADGSVITLDKFFILNEGYEINPENLNIQGSNVSINKDNANWQNTTVTFNGTGEATVSIYEYNSADMSQISNCATVTVNVTPVDKFIVNPDAAVDEDGIYHIPDYSQVSLGELFADNPENDAVINSSVEVAVITADGQDYIIDNAFENWEEITVAIEGTGNAVITVSQDSNIAQITVCADPIDKFQPAFDSIDKYVGEEVYLKDLFTEINSEYVESEKVAVTVNGDEYELSDTADWGSNAIKLNNSGEYTVSISEDSNVAVVTISAKLKDAFGAHTAPVKYVGESLTLGEIFYENTDSMAPAVNDADVVVKVNGEKVELTDTTDWTKNILIFEEAGSYTVTIEEAGKSNSVENTVTIENKPIIDKFDVVFKNTDKYTYRVGNQNTVALGSLFKAKEDVTIDSKTVTIDFESENGNLGTTYTANATDWTKGTIKFDGTDFATVTINADGSNPLSLSLDVVDAVNTTSAMSATSSNVVLLNDCGFGSLEVSKGYTLYGNGFTMTCGSDSPALDMGYAFVTLDSGILDNVQIVCPDFDYAALYKSNLTSSDNRSQTTDRTRYYNARSGVMTTGNSQILNSRISGARAALNVSSGNVIVENSRIELGAVASVLVGNANSVVLRDTTLVQKPTPSTYDSNKVLMGFSVLVICDSEGNSAPITIEGDFVQHAWINESDSKYVPSAGSSIVDTVLQKTEYLHDIDGDGINEALNLGFAYMPEEITSPVNATTINDNRTDKESIPYDYAEISILNGKTYVYSYKNTNGTADKFGNVADYVPNKYGDIINVTYSDSADGISSGKSFGVNGWVYELNVDLDKATGYALDFSKLAVNINFVNVTDYLVNGNAKPSTPVSVNAGGTAYVLTATVDGVEYTVNFKVTGTETTKESPSLVAANYEAGLCVASSYGGTWHGAAPALQGIQIKYWSVAEKQYKTINLSDYTPTTPGKQNGTNTTWTYSPANGDFTLTLTGGQVHSSNNVYAMPVVCDGKLYFVASGSKGLVNTGNSARTIPVSYSFKDNNNGKELTFSHSWSVAENKEAEYDYSKFCNGTLEQLTESSGGSGSNCVTADTLITLADGSQVRVDSLKGDESLLVWNLETGKYDVAPIVFVDSDEEAEYEVIHLYFSDGSDVKVISEHGFFDTDLGEYVYIDATNYAQYIGHKFVAEGDISSNEWNVVTLQDVVIEREVTTAWSPVTFGHLCYYTNGVLSMPGGIYGLFNIFEVDTDIMRYDEEKMQNDIETYGLFTLEDFGGLIPQIAFDAFNGDYLKVAMAKGLLTWEDIAYMAERYVPLV